MAPELAALPQSNLFQRFCRYWAFSLFKIDSFHLRLRKSMKGFSKRISRRFRACAPAVLAVLAAVLPRLSVVMLSPPVFLFRDRPVGIEELYNGRGKEHGDSQSRHGDTRSFFSVNLWISLCSSV